MRNAYDVDGPLIVGETYLAPTVTREWTTDGKKWDFAVMDRHVGDISGEDHLHFDTRFVPERILKMLVENDCVNHLEGIVASGVGEKDDFALKPHVCLRNWDGDYFPGNLETWRQLEGMFRDSKMEDGICPHHNFNLKQVKPVVVQGRLCKICPNHRLAWDTEDGTLIERE
jgi:hypothetical protein